MLTSPEKSPSEARLNYLAALLFVGSIAVTIYGLMTLPDRIPTHFGIDGKANGWGTPTALLVLPGICLFMLVQFWALRFVPASLMNFPGPRTPENIARQMQNIRQMVVVMRVLMAGLFLALGVQWVWAAAHPQQEAYSWFAFVFAGVLTGAIAFFVIRAYRLVGK